MKNRVSEAVCVGIVGFATAFAGRVMARAQIPAAAPAAAELQYVVYVTRHGVRSPTGKASQYSQYSAGAWPTWDVQPGYLTAHGFELIQKLGAYDRLLLQSEGLFARADCAAAGQVTVYADSDQRTRETGRALAAGMFPGCKVPVLGLDEGENDALFHPRAESIKPEQAALAAAAIGGRIGNQPAAVAEAYRSDLTALDKVLATCGTSADAGHARTSIFDVPASLTSGSGDHAAELRGPLNTAATLTENFLLEYTQGMAAADVGWGCVDGKRLRELIDLHTAASDLSQRTPAVAALQAGNLLVTIERSLEQAVTQHAMPHVPGKVSDRALFLIGHDTNLSNLAGMLELDWLLDGRRDDTPPGSTLVFELWRAVGAKEYSVRVYFMAQTLEQMREAQVLTLTNAPPRVPVFLPGCSGADLSCGWNEFQRSVREKLTTQR